MLGTAGTRRESVLMAVIVQAAAIPIHQRGLSKTPPPEV
jgi:hypothetical protein